MYSKIPHIIQNDNIKREIEGECLWKKIMHRKK